MHAIDHYDRGFVVFCKTLHTRCTIPTCGEQLDGKVFNYMFPLKVNHKSIITLSDLVRLRTLSFIAAVAVIWKLQLLLFVYKYY